MEVEVGLEEGEGIEGDDRRSVVGSEMGWVGCCWACSITYWFLSWYRL
jgi:hypothetical protein